MRLLTEDEARETECRVFPVGTDTGPNSGPERLYVFGRCIASKCALWETAADRVEMTWSRPKRMIEEGWEFNQRKGFWYRPGPAQGYCGLKRGTL